MPTVYRVTAVLAIIAVTFVLECVVASVATPGS